MGIDLRSIGQLAYRATITAFFASLVHASPAAAADRVIDDTARGGIRILVIEKQPPAEPQHGVSLQATHELSVKASANGVQITKLQITPGSNVDSTSGGNPVSGYLYLDAMPEKTLRALVLAADSAQPFNWSYRIEYQVNGQSQSAQRSVESSRPRVKSSGAAMPPMDLSALLADPSATGPSAGEATKMSSPAGNLAVLLADPVAPSHRASATAGEAATESAIDESLRNALTLRDQERDRKAYVARAESLRGGLLEEQKLLKEMVASTSREHVQIDERRAEAERRRRAEARSSQDNKLILGVLSGMGGAILANKAGFANAGEIGARLGTNIAQGNAAGGISEYSSAMNSGMSQRLATLEAQNRQAMAAQPQQLTDGQQISLNAANSSGRPSGGSNNASTTSSANTTGTQQRLYSGPDSCNSFAGHWARYAGAWHKKLDLDAGCGGGQYRVQTLRDWNGPASGYGWHCSRQQEIDGGQSARVTRWGVNGNTVSVWLSSGEKLNLQLHHRDGRPWLDDMIKQPPR